MRLSSAACFVAALWCATATAQNQAGRAATVALGMILPLTGDFAFCGEQAREGALLALEELRAEHPEQTIELVMEDDRCLPRDAVTAYQKLRAANHSQLVIGPFCTGSTLAVAPLVERDTAWLLAMLDAGKPIREAGNHILSLGFDSEQEAYAIIDTLQRKKISRVGVLYETDGWAEVVKDAFVSRFRAEGGTLSGIEAHEVSSKDYRPELTRLLERKPEALYLVPAYSGGVMLKQLRLLDKTIAVYGPDTFGVEETLTVAGDAIDGVIFANLMVDEDGATAERLRQRLQKATGKKPFSLLYSALGYDGLRIAYRLLTANEPPPTAAQTLKYADGVIRISGFDKDGNAVLEPRVMRYDGQVMKPE